MNPTFLHSCYVGLLVLGGCYSMPAPVLRTNFPGDLRLQLKCEEYKRDPAILASELAAHYQDGWRLAYVSEAHYGFIFYTVVVQVCYERPLGQKTADAPGAQGPQGQAEATPPKGPSAEAANPLGALDQALRAYDQEEYAAAATALEQIVAGKTNTDESRIPGAQFFLGKAHFKLKHYPESLAAFTVIATKGPSHPYFGKSLAWLVSLSHQLPQSAGILEALGKYGQKDADHPSLAPQRDEIYYLLGQCRLIKGEQQEGLELLGRIRPGTEFYDRARRLMAQPPAKKS